MEAYGGSMLRMCRELSGIEEKIKGKLNFNKKCPEYINIDLNTSGKRVGRQTGKK